MDLVTEADVVYTLVNSTDSTDSLDSLSYILSPSEVRANSIFYGFMIPLAICGNMLSIAVSSKILRHRKSYTDLLMGFLAFSDLLNIFGIHTFSIISLVAGHWVGGIYICGVQYYMAWSCLKFSFFILVMLTVDRYIALVKPLQYRSLVTTFRIKLGIFVTFVFSFGSTLVTVIGFLDTIGIVKGWYICMNNWSTSSTYYVAILVIYGLTYVVGLAVFTYCNIIVAVQLCRYSTKCCSCRTKEQTAADMVLTQSKTLIGKRAKKERKAARIILIISGLFFIFWGPYFVTIILTQIEKPADPEVTVVALRLLFANAFINPVIYACFNATYRRGFLYFTKLFLYYISCTCFSKPEDDNIFFERKSWRQEVIRHGMRSKSIIINNNRSSIGPESDSLPDVILTSSPRKTPPEEVKGLDLGVKQNDVTLDCISEMFSSMTYENNTQHCYDNKTCDVPDDLHNDSGICNTTHESLTNMESFDTQL
ncbi:5-hydroxytryptamine receptor 4-like [Antedon mediterranea]|uniref:5-hydroxytryptamine receptor 4-like n=1 Tax=Antedon mediterranea TaxID=105859 RepID=UPI003AF4EE99